FAAAQAETHALKTFELPMPAMFCLAIRRDTLQKIGPLDERFEIGMFEDDDYAQRLHAAGLRTPCAQDVFIHHFGQASFGDIIPTGKYGRLFEATRRRFEEKWNTTWHPHGRRRSSAYESLLENIRSHLRQLPDQSTLLIISKGDDALLAADPRLMAQHFPQDLSGNYAGHNPPDSSAAIGQHAFLRPRGAQFLLIPGVASWWLDYYTDFRRHLETNCKPIPVDDDSCTLFDLRSAAS